MLLQGVMFPNLQEGYVLYLIRAARVVVKGVVVRCRVQLLEWRVRFGVG